MGLAPAHVRALGRQWHPQCFRCAGCGQPLGGAGGGSSEFAVGADQLPYHAACHKELFHGRCVVCGSFLPTRPDGRTEWREHPFWCAKACPVHYGGGDGTPACCACGRLQPRAEEWVGLQDGRVLCLECLGTVVIDTKDAQPLYDEVLGFFASMGMPHAYKPPLLLVEGPVLQDYASREGRDQGEHAPMFSVRGLCVAHVYSSIPSVVRSLPGGAAVSSVATRLLGPPAGLGQTCAVSCLLVMYGLPRLLLGSIVAHELMHAYLRMRHVTGLPLQDWWASQQAQQRGGGGGYQATLLSYLGYAIRTDASDVYGEGFRIAMEAFQRRGIRALVEHVALPERETGKPALAASTRPDARAFAFDACMPGSTTQAEMFDICGMPELVDAAVDGHTVTVFAFGQTGSGKTHTIIGGRPAWPASSGGGGGAGDAGAPCTDDDEGLLARSARRLFAAVAARCGGGDCEASCAVSCAEVYNETVRQDATEGFYVEGLQQREAQTPERALALMSGALAGRATRAHALNSHSSRSHCLITLTVASEDGGVRRTGRLVLVDLAGSERLKESGSTAREAVRETGAINRSLFTLGQVLAALSVRGAAGVTGHVPYRDSRLTQLLWAGLRGGGRALMLACLSPLRAHAEESIGTLGFACIARRIKSQPVIMVDPQVDCRSLAGAVAELARPGADPAAVLQALPPTLVQDALRYGSSSAPSAQQGSGLRASFGRPGGRRPGASSLGGGGKPGSADGVLRRSLPAPYSSQPGGRAQRQRQGWNSSPALSPAAGFSVDGGGGGSARSSWPAFATPPRSGRNSPGSPVNSHGGARSPAAGGGGRARSRAGAAGGLGGSAAAWSAALYTQLGGATSSAGCNGGGPGSSLAACGAAEAFPELAALEQEFARQLEGQQGLEQQQQREGRQQQQQEQQHDQGQDQGLQQASVQFVGAGADGVFVPSGLRASIHAPGSLVPLRTSVTDAQTLGTSPGASPVAVAIAAAGSHVRPLAVSLHAGAGAGCAAPEPKALSWAERHPWFGVDVEMTALAYQAHDALVSGGADPASDEYYAALEARVAAGLPDRWARWQAAAAAPGRSPSSYTSFRLALKPGVPRLSGSGARRPGAGRAAPAREPRGGLTVSQLLQHPRLSGAGALHGAGQREPAALQPGEPPEWAFAEQMLQLCHHQQPQPPRLPELRQCASPVVPPTGARAVDGPRSRPASPGNALPALAHAAAPSSNPPLRAAQGGAPAGSDYDGAGPLTAGARKSWNSSHGHRTQGPRVQAGRDLAEVLRAGLSPSGAGKSLAELQADYRAARALVLDQLRQQKDEAEAERRLILLQIGRALGSSRWRA
ncbi:DA1 [Scenedesmus sp. PABB004]|nr:DA1 [Scenedesmus sp. PABB004]